MSRFAATDSPAARRGQYTEAELLLLEGGYNG
jgi:hypothetical protein